MIVVRLIGGLGNQLFQYAAGRTLSLRRGVDLAFDRRGFRWRDRRREVLRDFTIRPIRPSVPLPAIRDSRVAKWLGRRSPLQVVKERGFSFDAAILDLPDGCYLEGYFQSERYFVEAEAAIRCELAFARPPDATNASALELIRRSPSVSVHVRRGDYATHKRTNELFGTLGADYYDRAVEHVAGASNENLSLFVFSDDPEWTRANIRSRFPIHYMSHNGIRRPADDLRLMAACRHHILANSSFSWWGAWLNPSREKIVVAPQKWFSSGALDDSTLVPAEWKRV